MSVSILHGDCMEYMAGLADGAFDLAIVDPPYGIGASGSNGIANPQRWSTPKQKEYHDSKWDTAPPENEYFQELFRVSKSWVVWGANYFSLPPSRGIICWDKQNSGNYSDFELAFSSFSTPAKIFRYLWNGFQKQDPESRIHPTQKPVALYRWLLHNYAKPGWRILDTHLGSGSSAIAAHEMGYDFVGIEIDEEYVTAARKRFDMMTRQIALDL